LARTVRRLPVLTGEKCLVGDAPRSGPSQRPKVVAHHHDDDNAHSVSFENGQDGSGRRSLASTTEPETHPPRRGEGSRDVRGFFEAPRRISSGFLLVVMSSRDGRSLRTHFACGRCHDARVGSRPAFVDRTQTKIHADLASLHEGSISLRQTLLRSGRALTEQVVPRWARQAPMQGVHSFLLGRTVCCGWCSWVSLEESSALRHF
jgi:hypothetical protein